MLESKGREIMIIRLLAVVPMAILFFIGCSGGAEELFETAQFEELQKNRPHAIQLYREIIEKHPKSPHAVTAKERLAELEKEESVSNGP
jgi:hypothetical protein